MRAKAAQILHKFGSLCFTVELAVLLGLAGVGGCASESGVWYTRADNDYAQKHDTGGSPVDLSGAGGMEYSYTLPCWSAAGQEQELTFGSDDLIQEGTYLQIETQFLRGVTSWKEISSSEVPQDILRQIRKTIDE